MIVDANGKRVGIESSNVCQRVSVNTVEGAHPSHLAQTSIPMPVAIKK
jgi:hypothetical protein